MGTPPVLSVITAKRRARGPRLERWPEASSTEASSSQTPAVTRVCPQAPRISIAST